MSVLDIDIGNSRLKWRRRGSTAVEYCMHDGDPATALTQVLSHARGALRVAHVFGSEVEDALRAAAEARGARDLRFARTQAEHDGLRLAYAEPQRMGVDRFLAMAALWRERRAGFIAVSAGTALTVDIVDDRGQHLGGFIAPGLHAMRTAVLDRTQFPHAFDAPAYDRPGTNTESCVAEAALGATLGLIERTQGRYGCPGFLSGGDAVHLAQFMDAAKWHLREHLVLDGLACLREAES
ncbi:type III pantothenate kinase [Algiphilus sp.]|uniref:type III pantothenate kinase n=1 Tax=Algiphilus sp. TaxID=1872431 RepID=UPI0032EDDA53